MCFTVRHRELLVGPLSVSQSHHVSQYLTDLACDAGNVRDGGSALTTVTVSSSVELSALSPRQPSLSQSSDNVIVSSQLSQSST